MTPPTITTKQQEILKLLYRYRFVDRTQLQAFLHHKDKRPVSRWLKDLREKHYIDWIYDTSSLTTATTPAIYYLGINGIRFLRSTGNYQPQQLSKRYHDSTRKLDFIARCLLIANCGVNLEAKTTGQMHYTFVTAADYTNPNNELNFLSDEPRPQLCFIKETPSKKVSYLLEVFEPTTRSFKVKKRLKDYVTYLLSGGWEDETGDEDPPTALIACPDTNSLAYAKRQTRKLLADMLGDDDNDEDEDNIVQLRFATTEQVKRQGVTAIIWKDL